MCGRFMGGLDAWANEAILGGGEFVFPESGEGVSMLICPTRHAVIAYWIVCSIAVWGMIVGATRAYAEPASAAATEPAEVTMYTMILLHEPGVTAELKLTPQQSSTIGALLTEVEYPFFLLRDATAEQRNKELPPIQESLRQKLSTALNASQRSRLSQLVFQARGSGAIVSPENVAKLGLSEDQIQRIAKIHQETKSTLEQIDKNGAGRKVAEQATLRSKRYTQEYADIVALLNDKQRPLLAGMIGKSFDLARLKWVATTAPELRNVEAWINSQPLELKQLRGKVVIVHFWAFGCINCIRNLPCYQRWYEKFPADQVAIVGIHTPETDSERSVDNLRAKVTEYGIKYPVAFDAKSDNWRAWANNMWPSVYVIDKQGRVRTWWYGELNWQGTPGEDIFRKRIEAILEEK